MVGEVDGPGLRARRRHDRHRRHHRQRRRPARASGAPSTWCVAATHGVLSGPAVDRLKNAPIREVVVSNTLPIPAEKHFDGLRVLSIAPIIAEALDAVFAETSVSEIFRGDNV